jgi:hypothetical protein
VVLALVSSALAPIAVQITIASPAGAVGPTNVSGTITGTQTWTPDDSPYLLSGSVALASGASLTIAAGTVVK